MTPTPKLRFVERSIPMHPFYKNIDSNGNTVQAMQTVRVLQQLWEADITDIITGKPQAEWRDVPVEKE